MSNHPEGELLDREWIRNFIEAHSTGIISAQLHARDLDWDCFGKENEAVLKLAIRDSAETITEVFFRSLANLSRGFR